MGNWEGIEEPDELPRNFNATFWKRNTRNLHDLNAVLIEFYRVPLEESVGREAERACGMRWSTKDSVTLCGMCWLNPPLTCNANKRLTTLKWNLPPAAPEEGRKEEWQRETEREDWTEHVACRSQGEVEAEHKAWQTHLSLPFSLSHSTTWYIYLRVCVCVAVCVVRKGALRWQVVREVRLLQFVIMTLCNDGYEWGLCVCVCVQERLTCICVCECVCVYMPLKQTTCAFICSCACVWGTRIFETFLIGRNCRPSLHVFLSHSIRCAAIVLCLNSKSISRCILQRQQRSCWLTETIQTHIHRKAFAHSPLLEGESEDEQPFNTQLHFD